MLDTNFKNTITNKLNEYETIGLNEMNENASLMDRVDSKFIFNDNRLISILDELKDDYYILFVDDTKLAPYETLYFDTHDLELYTKHHNQWAHRHKIRYRRYVNSDLNFFELKEKINTGRTIKKRIPTGTFHWDSYKSSFDLFSRFFLKNENVNLLPSLWVYFSRMTFTKKDYSERATIDVGLAFKAIAPNAPLVSLNNIGIVETKQPKINRSSPIMRTLKKHAIYPLRVSKYCTGVANCYQGIKKNKFKQKLLLINKIQNQNFIEHAIG